MNAIKAKGFLRFILNKFEIPVELSYFEKINLFGNFLLIGVSIYPKGEMAFSPFLMNQKDNKDYLIGNLGRGLPKSFLACEFNFESTKCKNCLSRFGNRKTVFGNASDILNLRNNYSVYFAKTILRISQIEVNFARYIEEAKKRVFD